MAQSKVSFEGEKIETILGDEDIYYEAYLGLAMVVSHTIATLGLRWVDRAGYMGLDRDITENMKKVDPEGCARFEESCLAEINFNSGERGGEGSIAIICPRPYLDDAKTKAEANELEAQQSKACKACHLQMSESIINWLSDILVAAERAEQKVALEEAALMLAKNARNAVFELPTQPQR